MRALTVLIVFVLGFVLVLKFYPRTDEGMGASPTRAAERPHEAEPSLPAAAPSTDGGPEEARFLPPPDDGLHRPAADPPEDASWDGGRPSPSTDPGAAARPAWLTEVAAVSESRALLGLAAALVHGGPPEVEAAIAAVKGELSMDLAGAVRAFSLALAGRRDRALEELEGVDFASLPAAVEGPLQTALGGRAGAGASLEAARRSGPLELALAMALRSREAGLSLEVGQYESAAKGFSELLLAEVDAPWEADAATLRGWAEGLARAQSRYRWDAEGTWPSVEVPVEEGDSLIAVRRKYLEQHPGELMCSGLIERANGVVGYIHPGQVLRIPTDPVSVLVDLSARWVLYLQGGEVVAAWPCGVGRPGEETMTGRFVAGEKLENPMWFPRGREPIPFGDPRNPLGTRWIGWKRDGKDTAFGFHGTNDPPSIGHAASDGCIRMRNEDAEMLFAILPVGAPILVRE